MFQAIREYFARPDEPLPRRGRGRRLTSLFLFEFIVVVLGVLAAQLLQQWAGDLRERSDAERAVAQTREDITVMRANAEYWLRVAPCLARHVDAIARAAGEGRTLARGQIGRPALPGLDQIPWSEATSGAVRRRFGSAAAAELIDLASTAKTIDDSQLQLASRWAAFPLLDPDLGQPSTADRANVRFAAAQVATDLNLIVFQSRYVVGRAAEMGIRSSSTRKSELVPLVDDCGLLRRWNSFIDAPK